MGRWDAVEFEAGLLEERAVLGLGALLAFGQGEHADVEYLAGVKALPSGRTISMSRVGPEVFEIQAIVAELQVRERVLLFLDMATGLRRGELAGVKWYDFGFADLDIDVQRPVVDQVVRRCKTEAS